MDNDILKYVTCLNGQGVLYTKGKKSALFDCGMAHKLPFGEIKRKLGNAPLDYLFVTHSHYDHLGALPFVKEMWPECQVLGSAYAQYVLTRPGALATIREYSVKAAGIDNAVLAEYPDSRMKIDVALMDGEMADLIGAQVQAVELPGHTKCSMGYLIDQTILIGSESTGYLNDNKEIIPFYLVSGIDALHSVEICQRLNPQIMIPPHGVPMRSGEWPDYWADCRQAIRQAQNLILDSYRDGKSEADILQLMKGLYWQGDLRIAQPEFAYDINTQVMIRVTLAEEEQIKQLRRSIVDVDLVSYCFSSRN